MLKRKEPRQISRQPQKHFLGRGSTRCPAPPFFRLSPLSQSTPLTCARLLFSKTLCDDPMLDFQARLEC